MCEIYVKADPILYELRTRSIRIHGIVTSIRLENLSWDILARIASRDGVTTNQLICQLYDEVIRQHSAARIPQRDGFASQKAGVARHDLGARIIQRQQRPAKGKAIVAELGHVRMGTACSPPEQSTMPRRRHA